MKALFLSLFLCFAVFTTMAQQKSTKAPQPDPDKKMQTVEAACGQCRFGLQGKGCNLAVRINGVAYFVDGTDIDSHGDAHAEDGFCNAVRNANVQGEVVDNRFKATYFQLVADTPKKKKTN